MSFYDLMEQIDGLLDRITRIETRMSNQVRHGPVTDVDTEKQTARHEIGRDADGNVVKSPPVPYGQFAGKYKSHTPPVIGQQMSSYSPDGEFRQAVMLPFTWSNEFKSPSDKKDEHVHTYGDKYRIREKEKLREVTIDKVKRVQSDTSYKVTVNGGNAPKDNNGTKADDGQNDQEGQGSSFLQEEKKITSKVVDTTIVHDEKGIAIDAAETLVLKAGQKIALQVGGAEVEITAAQIAFVASAILAAGETFLGVDGKGEKNGQQIVTLGGPALKAKAKV